jgi:Na+/H+ antiporter NhaC
MPHSTDTNHITPRALALLPFAVFLILYIGSGIYFSMRGVDCAFHQLPAPVATLPAIIIAMLISHTSLKKTLELFIQGVGEPKIINMCLIFLLSGAFTSVAQSTGSIEAAVQLSLSGIPKTFLLPGIFLISASLATAMGTSMGTIAALAPIAFGLSEAASLSPAFVAGALMSGAMFGDNLSIISDTTIAAISTQGCQMKGKFKENSIIAIPAAFVTTIGFCFFSSNPILSAQTSTEVVKILPYLIILLLALLGFNVLIVLTIGIFFAGLIGMIFFPDYHLILLAQNIYTGFVSMQDIFILSMLIGGLAILMEKQGGLSYISHKISWIIAHFSKQQSNGFMQRAAEVGIAFMVSVANLCTANNTIAILCAGSVAKDIADKHAIRSEKTACLLDIFSCVIQGLIPYGAQALLLSTLFHLSPLSVVTHAYYPMVLAFSGILFILFRK